MGGFYFNENIKERRMNMKRIFFVSLLGIFSFLKAGIYDDRNLDMQDYRNFAVKHGAGEHYPGTKDVIETLLNISKNKSYNFPSINFPHDFSKKDGVELVNDLEKLRNRVWKIARDLGFGGRLRNSLLKMMETYLGDLNFDGSSVDKVKEKMLRVESSIKEVLFSLTLTFIEQQLFYMHPQSIHIEGTEAVLKRASSLFISNDDPSFKAVVKNLNDFIDMLETYVYLVLSERAEASKPPKAPENVQENVNTIEDYSDDYIELHLVSGVVMKYHKSRLIELISQEELTHLLAITSAEIHRIKQEKINQKMQIREEQEKKQKEALRRLEEDRRRLLEVDNQQPKKFKRVLASNYN
jgi:hypothetical protein